MAPHTEEEVLGRLKSNIVAHNPSRSGDLRRELRKSLLWLRDELRSLPCTSKCRNAAAADLIHMYAYTECFFIVREYETVTSPSIYLSPLDLGRKDNKGSTFEFHKTYDESYCLSQLIYWHTNETDPVCSLTKSRKGCLTLPDVSSLYASSDRPVKDLIYGSKTLKCMISRMERRLQLPWPDNRIWLFKSKPKFFGSPMMDAVNKEMMHWLKTRPNVFRST